PPPSPELPPDGREVISTQVVPVPGTLVVGARAYTVDTIRGGRYTGAAIMERDTYKYVYSDTRRAYQGTLSATEVAENRYALDIAIAEARKTGVCPRSPARVRAVCEVFMRIVDRPIVVIPGDGGGPTPDERDVASKECTLGKELAYRNNSTEIAMCRSAGGRVVSIDNGDACGRNAKVECAFHSPEQPPDGSGS
ncbi:hypothetical protein, partial [Marilutibacter aestuarii]|uniref:hypothetical protein n=1 Tax=Marilutibacter aestuarii TaxID=1706195 RepID=UPI001B886A74